MARYKYSKDSNISLKDCYETLLKIKPQMTKTEFAVLINTTRQNVWQRLNKKSMLTIQERDNLKAKLEELNIPTKFLNVAVVSDSMVQVPLRSEVELSCGTGTVANADFVADSIRFDVSFIKKFGGNPNAVSIVFARGDSMADKIESGDALIIDESKNYIVNGKVYAFVYDSELYCKQLNVKSGIITATSFNENYKPFEIDKSKQFTVVGQVISAMKRI